MKNNILFILLSLILLLNCSKKQQKNGETEEILSVEAQEISTQIYNEPIIASGALASKSEMKLAFKTGGMIKKVYIEEGQSVRAGQLLAELDMSEIDAQVRQAQLGLEKASRDLERVKKLYADEAVPLNKLEDANTGFDVAKQSVQVAEFNQKLSKIYAPNNGRILRKIAESGELITPFAPVFILGTGESAFILNVGLSDKNIVQVKIGDLAQITLDAYPNETFQGRISQIAQTVNPMTGTYEAEIQLENKQGKKLISGFVAQASIITGYSDKSLVAPIESIIEADKNRAFVYRLNTDNKTVHKTPVIIGKIVGNGVQILSGIEEKTKIITKGANFLSDRSKVKVVNP